MAKIQIVKEAGLPSDPVETQADLSGVSELKCPDANTPSPACVYTINNDEDTAKAEKPYIRR